MIKNIDRWVEKKVKQYVERAVKEWREYMMSEWVKTSTGDATQDEFEEFCDGLEDDELIYRAEQEEYWRNELYSLAVNTGMIKLSES